MMMAAKDVIFLVPLLLCALLGFLLKNEKKRRDAEVEAERQRANRAEEEARNRVSAAMQDAENRISQAEAIARKRVSAAMQSAEIRISQAEANARAEAAEICKKAEQFIRDEREAIRNEKQEMQTLTEKELLIECMSALQTYASRLDRLENKMSNISISIDSVAKKVAKTKKPYTHVGAITDAELIGIVQEAAKRIGRITEITVNDAVVQGIVLSQNKLSTWSFSIDFNDDGRLTGNYTVLSDNMDSTIPQRLAKEISKEILYRLNGKG